MIREMNLDTYILSYFMLIVKEQCFCFYVVKLFKTFTKESQIAKYTLLLRIKFKLRTVDFTFLLNIAW